MDSKKIKMLYANGCSWTAGADLEDPSNTAWPILLSKKMEVDVFNAGLGGGSNDRILRTTIQFTKDWMETNNPTELFVGIMWTSMYRTEVPFEENKNLHYEAIQFGNPWYTGYWKEYKDNWVHKHVIDEDQLFQYSKTVISLWLYLKHHNIPFLFMDSFNSVSYSTALSAYLGVHDDSRIDQSFGEYISKNKLKLGKTNHPLEDAHAGWATYLYENAIHKWL